MNQINIFFNTSIYHTGYADNDRDVDGPFSQKVANLGNWCLSPVRYLFNGKNLVICTLSGKEARNINIWEPFPKRSFLKLAASIALIIPGLLLGSVFKSLSYLSESRRFENKIAVEIDPRT